jgi:hypothetical protein
MMIDIHSDPALGLDPPLPAIEYRSAHPRARARHTADQAGGGLYN